MTTTNGKSARGARAATTTRRLAYSDLSAAYASIGKERNWMIEGAIEGAPIVILAGPEKRGKSWILADLVRVVTTGGKWLGAFEARVRGSALVVENEYGSVEYARREARLARGAGRDPDELLRADGPVRHYCGHDLLLTEDNAAFCDLLADVSDDPPALIVIDPLRNYLPGEENSVPDTIAAMRCIARLRDASGAFVVAAHHLNRQGTMSGSRALRTRADLFLEGSDEDEPEYTTIGRTVRSKDAIVTPFRAVVRHEHDDDDTIATTTIACKLRGESHTRESMSTSAKRMLDALKRETSPATVNRIGVAANITSGKVRMRALEDLRDLGLAKRTKDGKWAVATSEFYRGRREKAEERKEGDQDAAHPY